ncbi:MAG: pilus assembly protein PilC [Deltaproteobacteria bacterium HGW-Deltaproteobacteria-4]|nr:MAG: pilus assembly protein PilC [Deltaproteobacteria bacterium HGW-Deltaproteobacteria-4]
MPTYAWEGKNRQGATQKGNSPAANEAALSAELRRKGIMVTSIRPKSAMKFSFGSAGSVSSKDLVVFTRQFCTMIDAGLPLVQCLDILSRQQDNPYFKKCLFEVKESVESGSTFAEALGKHPRIFDELYVNLVAAGEVGGILDTILNRLAAYIEKSLKLKKQVKSAMTYPVTIIGIASVVVGVILIFVIPSFESMFESFNQALPMPTQIVINMSRGLKKYIIVILGAIWLFIFLCKRFYASPKGRELVDHYALKMPVVGVLIRKVAVAKFTRTLGTMISSGVPILDGLEIVAKTAGNRTVEKAIYQVRQSISEGKTIAEPLTKSGVFPPMVCQMIAVGEQAGAIDTMLNKIADFYDDEVDDAVGNLTAMMEPLLMLFLGTVVGGLVIAMYLPIFKLAGAVG